MATPLFKLHVEQFWRRMGEPNVSITLGNPTLVPSGIQRYTNLDQIYDYFWLSGISLFRAIDRFTKQEVGKMLPSFHKSVVDQALTTGSYTPTEKIERIIDPVIIEVTSNVKKPGYLIPENVINLCVNGTGLRAISSDYPGYYIANGKVNVLPAASLKISFNYIKSVERIILTDQATPVDIWTDNYSEMLIQGACAYAKGDANDVALEAKFYQMLNNSYQISSAPVTNQNNSLIEQQ